MKTTKDKLLQVILKNEALEAKYGAIAEKACNEMAERFGDYKKGEKVMYKPSHYSDDKDPWRFGIVARVSYSSHEFMKYTVQRMTDNWGRMHERDGSFNYITSEQGKIKKASE